MNGAGTGPGGRCEPFDFVAATLWASQGPPRPRASFAGP
jgi:hypothetical protein